MTIRRISYIWAALLGVVLICSGLFFAYRQVAQAETVRVLADNVMAACAEDTNKESCYEKRISALYPAYALNDIFNVIRAVRAADPEYQFCHVLGHLLGEAVVAQDPSQWLDYFALNPTDGLCSNGFLHGIIGGKFRNSVLDAKTLDMLVPDLSGACEPRSNWSPTPLEETMCYHAMGHLYVMVTYADMHEALRMCERTAGDKGTGDYTDQCFAGVFMQIYQPLEDSDYALIDNLPVKPTAQNVRAFCAAYKKADYVGACLRESWPLFKDALLEGDGARAFCSGQPDKKNEDLCYLSVDAIIGRSSLAEPERIGDRCSHMPATRVAECVTMAARAVLEEDKQDAQKAIGVCQQGIPAVAYQCISGLINTAVFTLGYGTPELRAFCAALPEPFAGACNEPD